MFTARAECAGDVAVIWVSEATVKLRAALEAKRTAVAPANPLPVIRTTVPPAVLPVPGATAEIAGAAVTAVKRSPLTAALVPPSLVTRTS